MPNFFWKVITSRHMNTSPLSLYPFKCVHLRFIFCTAVNKQYMLPFFCLRWKLKCFALNPIYKIIWIVRAFWLVYKCVFIALWNTKIAWAMWFEIGRAHVWTPVTPISRMPSSAWKKKNNLIFQHESPSPISKNNMFFFFMLSAITRFF